MWKRHSAHWSPNPMLKCDGWQLPPGHCRPPVPYRLQGDYSMDRWGDWECGWVLFCFYSGMLEWSRKPQPWILPDSEALLELCWQTTKKGGARWGWIWCKSTEVSFFVNPSASARDLGAIGLTAHRITHTSQSRVKTDWIFLHIYLHSLNNQSCFVATCFSPVFQ